MLTANRSSTCCTITMAAGKSRGSPPSTFASAAGPPAEEPITTSPPVRDSGRTGGAAGLATTRSPRLALTFAIRSITASRAAAGARDFSGASVGVSTASSAPWPIASNTRCAFVPTLEVTMRIAHGVFAMICRVASTPSMRGMIRSMRIRSGVSFAHIVTASAPSFAIQTT